MTSIRDHSFHLDLPGQSVMERAGVLNVLYIQCVGVVCGCVWVRGYMCAIAKCNESKLQLVRENRCVGCVCMCGCMCLVGCVGGSTTSESSESSSQPCSELNNLFPWIKITRAILAK